MTNIKNKEVADLAGEIKSAGFRVFVSKEGAGDYGFYTDASGSRIICFSVSPFYSSFSGNYISENPSKTGTGWELKVADYKTMINEAPPLWAIGRTKVRPTNLGEYLAGYQRSSKFSEV